VKSFNIEKRAAPHMEKYVHADMNLIDEYIDSIRIDIRVSIRCCVMPS